MKKVIMKFSKLMLVLLFVISAFSNNIYKPIHSQATNCIKTLDDGDYSWMLETR